MTGSFLHGHFLSRILTVHSACLLRHNLAFANGMVQCYPSHFIAGCEIIKGKCLAQIANWQY